MAIPGVSALTGLGGGLGQILTALNQPVKTITKTTKKGKTETIEVTNYSKLDVIMVVAAAIGVYLIFIEWKEAKEDEGSEGYAGKPKGWPVVKGWADLGITQIVDPLNLFGMHDVEREKVEELIEWLIP